MRIIGIKLRDGDPNVIKNLKTSTWYPFGNYQEPTKENGWQWLAPELKEQEELCNQMYKSVTDSDAFAPQMQITVNCIVGRNGSGKSTLLELLLRIINNFAFITIDKNWTESILGNNPQIGHRLAEAKGFAATLFFETDGHVGSIEYVYGIIKYNYPEKSFHLKLSKQKAVRPITTGRLKNFLTPFFYTVCTNYSIYSFNEDDYQSKNLWNKGIKGIDGNWLRGLLQKNDGYLAPIAMVPYRNEGGGINMGNEKTLAKQRLATLAVLFKSQQKSFMGEYEVQELVYRFNDNASIFYEKRFKQLIKEKLPLNDEKTIREKLMNTWNRYLTDHISKFTKHSKKVRDSILNYLTYKTFKICLQYRSFGEKMGIKELNEQKIEGQDKNEIENVWVADLPVEYASTIVEKICKEEKEPSHITLKIHQMLEFLKRNYYKIPDETQANVNDTEKELLSKQKIINVKELISFNLNFDNNKTSEEKKQKFYKTYDDVFLFMPPAIFEWDITFRRLNDSKQKKCTTLSQMSSGEKQLLQSFSYVLYHLKNLQSVIHGKFNIPFHHITLIFDEAELYYHPEYQRQFISQLIKMLSWCHIDGRKIRGINIIVVTHSPFVLSDVPAVHTLYLKDGEVMGHDNQTFGANIHELLANQFFVKDTMGNVSRENVERVAILYQRMIDGKEKKEALAEFRKNMDMLEYTMSIIGEPYIRNVSQGMLKELKKEAGIPLDTMKDLENERKQLEDRLKEINGLIDKNNQNS